jgi:hypothetical protein
MSRKTEIILICLLSVGASCPLVGEETGASPAPSQSPSAPSSESPFTNQVEGNDAARDWNLTGKPADGEKSWIQKGAKGGSDLDSLWILQTPQSQKQKNAQDGEEKEASEEDQAMESFARDLFGLSSDMDKTSAEGGKNRNSTKGEGLRKSLNANMDRARPGIAEGNVYQNTDGGSSEKSWSRTGWDKTSAIEHQAQEPSALMQKGLERSASREMPRGLGSLDHAGLSGGLKPDNYPSPQGASGMGMETFQRSGDANLSSGIRPKIMDIRSMNSQERNAMAQDATLDPRIPRLQATPRAESTAPFKTQSQR